MKVASSGRKHPAIPERTTLAAPYGLVVQDDRAFLAYLTRARVTEGLLSTYDAYLAGADGKGWCQKPVYVDAKNIVETWATRPRRRVLLAALSAATQAPRIHTLLRGNRRDGAPHVVVVPRRVNAAIICELGLLGFRGLVRFEYLPEGMVAVAKDEAIRTGRQAPEAAAETAVVYDERELDEFVAGFLQAWLFFDNPPPANESEDWSDGDSYHDAGFSIEDLTPGSMRTVRRHCAEFLDEAAHLIPGSRKWFEGSEFEHAGHDFALSSQRLAEGFDREEWSEPARTELQRNAERMGLSIEPVRGKLHVD